MVKAPENRACLEMVLHLASRKRQQRSAGQSKCSKARLLSYLHFLENKLRARGVHV